MDLLKAQKEPVSPNEDDENYAPKVFASQQSRRRRADAGSGHAATAEEREDQDTGNGAHTCRCATSLTRPRLCACNHTFDQPEPRMVEMVETTL